MSRAGLTAAQRYALKACSGSRSMNAQELVMRPCDLAVLVRWGLLESRTSSEQVRGEHRIYWKEYRTTPAGRTSLAAPDADRKERE